MDCPIVVSSTDEEKVVDIEGDDDEDKPNCEVRTNNVCDTTKSEIVESQVPFSRKIVTKIRRNENKSAVEDDFTKWWKSCSKFPKTVSPSNDSVDSKPAKQSPGVNPILRDPARKEVATFDLIDEKIYDDSGEVFQPPEKEMTMSPSEVTEDEREKFPEFFSGRTRYSPHNYITIRNTILKLWSEKKPEHVNKVVLRPVLRKISGNVNNIGKIHRYLESMGAINFGSDAVWWKRRRRKIPVYRPPKTALDTDYKLKRALEQRRRRKRPFTFSKELPLSNTIGGYTIDHANNDKIHVKKRVSEKNQKVQSKKYNLVKCREFSSNEKCPYDVTIDSSSLIVMDVHSHLSTHEVMGLIGGNLTRNEDGKIELQIKCAQPCKSFASSRHCEMDPVSQSRACEQIALRGLKVVGWYHSHPTFPPHPSETDIATQVERQSMFAAHDSAFLGVILTPYYKHQLKTDINFIHVEDGGIPFSVPYRTQTEPPDVGSPEYEDLMTALKMIIDSSTEIAGKEISSTSRLSHLPDPVVQASSVTHLDKIFRSLSSHVTNAMVTSQSDSMIIREPLSSGEDFFDDVPSESGLVVPISVSSCEIVTSSLHSDDDANESYSIDQNFPSLADNGLVCQDNDDIIEDVTTSPVTSQVVTKLSTCSDRIADSWNNIFDDIKSMLLNASETILQK